MQRLEAVMFANWEKIQIMVGSITENRAER